jgi:hypothetical protein
MWGVENGDDHFVQGFTSSMEEGKACGATLGRELHMVCGNFEGFRAREPDNGDTPNARRG